MKKIIGCLVSTLLILLWAAVISKADGNNTFFSDESSFSSSNYDTLQTLKKQIVEVLSQNKRLEAEYAQIKDKYETLKFKRDQFQQKQGDLPEDVFSNENKVDNKNVELDQWALDNSRNLYLSKQLMDSQEGRNLLELKLADLQYQKRELELELKLRQYSLQEQERLDGSEIRNLQSELEKNLLQEKKLEEQLASIESNIADLPQKNNKLEQEVSQLEVEVPKEQKEFDFKIKEINILKNKKILKEKADDNTFVDQRLVKQNLEKDIIVLQSQYDELDKNIQNSLKMQNRKKELIDQIVVIDKENQSLQTKINDVQEELKGFAP